MSVAAEAGLQVQRSGSQGQAGRGSALRAMRRNWQMYAMLLPGALLLVVFRLLPLYGISIAFVDYFPTSGVLESPFVGLEHFQRIFTMREGVLIIRNTVTIAVGKIIVGQIVSIAFAIAIFQIALKWFRRLAQVLAAVPHFLSWVIIGGMMSQMLNSTGVVNTGIKALGFPGIPFLVNQAVFPWT